ncbi:DUF4062 domain-containing protein [Flavobacterium sp.]|uniref:DUF4062 domain-containing protein n=1 Tax=Flavobacterium sp. TaxID=239 RepID=UPI002B4AFFF8|nr:DUF4062 domain-containing protein [Flavobacterium sp.]HLP64745.1 DUF4062 domain-containing protein [Flavobacterium sp.]
MIKTNHLYKRYQVFISSTFKDLKEERDQIRKALVKGNYIIEGMEIFPASNKKQWSVITERIDKTDIYVLVIGDRYGTITDNGHELEPDLVTEGESISFTHLEFRYAKKIGLPVLAFIKTEREENKEVDQFIHEVQNSDLTTAYWDGSLDLVSDILAGLSSAISEEGFDLNNGWVKVSSLNKPIDSGNKEVFLEAKTHYIKFVSYADKRTTPEPLYKKHILRVDKDFDVWDEYITLTVNQLSHYVKDFQYYVRTDGDAVDFSTVLPFINKLHFSDVKSGLKDTVFNPTIDLPSNTFVNACSFINGFQDGNTDLGVKATYNTKVLRMLVDFTSIPNYNELFVLKQCVELSSNQLEVDISDKVITIQDGVYLIEKHDVEKNTVLKFKFQLES